MMAYSEELSMFTVHHYFPIPILHVYTCMCIYPDCDKLMASSVWHSLLTSMSTHRYYSIVSMVYPTFKNLINRDYCRLCQY